MNTVSNSALLPKKMQDDLKEIDKFFKQESVRRIFSHACNGGRSSRSNR